MLEIKNITKEYKNSQSSTLAIDNINFAVQDTEFVSIIGPSGCGKSTILRIISGLDKQTSGEILFSKGRKDTNIGLISQTYALFPWLTVCENIAFGLKLKNTKKSEVESIVKKYLLVTGLDKFKDSYPSQLSGGMQQRVAIVRTLATNPDIIIMDEPFGALDVQTRSQMQEFLVKILKEENKTVVMVTHDIEEAIYLSDRIVVLSTKPGTVKEIIHIDFAKPRKPELKNKQEFIEIKKSISYLLKSESIKSTTDERVSTSSKEDLVIGANIWTGIAPLYLAQEKGIFDAYGLKPKIITLEWSEDRLDPLRNKQVDALDTPLDSALQEISKDPNMEIFMPLDYSFGGDALISNKEIKTISDLKGKTIGIEKGWVSDLFLRYILAKEGLSISDVITKDIKASDIGKELLLGNIQAASVQEPWLTKIKEYTEVTVLKTTKEYEPLIYAVLLVRKDVLQEKKKSFEAFKKSWNESVLYLKNNPMESISAAAPYLGLSEMEFAEQLQNIEFQDLEVGMEKAVEETRTFVS
jgi:NitT/TauT family transport system ATP-binding protein